MSVEVVEENRKRKEDVLTIVELRLPGTVGDLVSIIKAVEEMAVPSMVPSFGVILR